MAYIVLILYISRIKKFSQINASFLQYINVIPHKMRFPCSSFKRLGKPQSPAITGSLIKRRWKNTGINVYKVIIFSPILSSSNL